MRCWLLILSLLALLLPPFAVAGEKLKLARDYNEAVDLLRTGKVQIASLGDVTFFEACVLR